MKKLLLLCTVLLVGQNSFGVERLYGYSCQGLLTVIKQLTSQLHPNKLDEYLLQEHSQAYKSDFHSKKSKYKDIKEDLEFMYFLIEKTAYAKCKELDWFNEEIAELRQ